VSLKPQSRKPIQRTGSDAKDNLQQIFVAFGDRVYGHGAKKADHRPKGYTLGKARSPGGEIVKLGFI
jgi:hypothetical protein